MRFYGDLTVISLGSNMTGSWGSPQEMVSRALKEIACLGVRPIAQSMLYKTAPYGGVRQEAFVNAAALIETPRSAQVLLRLFKQIEARAGRAYSGRGGLRWGPRPLDIDIIDYKGVVRNWKMRAPILGMSVILPHAEAHKRAFVLRPLAEIAPFWHHPVFGLTASELLKKPGVAKAGAVLEKLEDCL
jgi:2-amino-4-hydroxy-6-hydroxymethyldihydropteridine diphosphokinase